MTEISVTVGIDGAALPARRDDAEHEAGDDRENVLRDHQQERRGQPRQDHFDHGLPGHEGIAEVAPCHVAEIDQELARQGIVQAELAPKIGDVFGRYCRVADDVGDRVAGREPDEEEVDDHDDEQDRQQLNKPHEHISGHRAGIHAQLAFAPDALTMGSHRSASD